MAFAGTGAVEKSLRSGINQLLLEFEPRGAALAYDTRRRKCLAGICVFISGASALVYQIVWHRYLTILLGAQARATAVVLAVFLGGLGAGYWIFGRWSQRIERPLLVFAAVEAGLAFWAFLFPSLFTLLFDGSSFVLMRTGIPGALWDFLVSITLLAPPTILMGATLPLLTQAFSRDVAASSRIHALIYGINTIGSCAGCIMAEWFLIPRTELGLASMAGGLGNLFVAATFFFLSQNVSVARAGHGDSTERSSAPWPFLGLAFISGFVILSLETILIRVIGMSTGSLPSNYALVVAIFIAALAGGSLSLSILPPVGRRGLFWNQVWLGISLLMLYFAVNVWPWIFHGLRASFRDHEENYAVYRIAMALALFIMLAVPLFLAGRTLPLCFHHIRKTKANLGWRVGQIYSANTAGCIAGALSGLVLLRFFDLDVFFQCCLTAMIFSTVCGWFVSALPSAGQAYRLRNPSVITLCAVILLSVVLPRWDKRYFLEPFMYRKPISGVTYSSPSKFGDFLGVGRDILFWRDGPDGTAGVLGFDHHPRKEKKVPESRVILTNGKSDGNALNDFITPSHLAHLGSLLTPNPRSAAVFGFGTGITSGTLMLYPGISQVHTIELSAAHIEAAPLFDSFNWGVTKNPKHTMHHVDAMRFIQEHPDKFDVIVSEPSHPWQGGIENLYARDFYGLAKNRLAPSGTFVQWVNVNHMNLTSLQIVLRSFTQEFIYTSVHALQNGDIALVGKMEPPDRALLEVAQQRMDIKKEAAEAHRQSGLDSFTTLLGGEIMSGDLPARFSASAQDHSLEAPRLAHAAAPAFFSGMWISDFSFVEKVDGYRDSLSLSLLHILHGGKSLSKFEAESAFKFYCRDATVFEFLLCKKSLLL